MRRRKAKKSLELNAGVAYAFWALGFYIGFPGFHRLYLRKYDIGTWLRFIPGLGHILALFDLVTIPSQVREINTEVKYHAILAQSGLHPEREAPHFQLTKAKETPEQVILRTAKKNRGLVTPGEVALEGNLPLEEARKNLDALTAKGYIEMRVRQSGVIVYTFPEFMDHGEDEKLLDI